MIERNNGLSIACQERELNISGGSIHYKVCPVSAADLTLMRRIDGLHLDYPFAGSSMLKERIKGEGHEVGHLHIATLMDRMGL